jgi:hypothetical protein
MFFSDKHFQLELMFLGEVLGPYSQNIIFFITYE